MAQDERAVMAEMLVVIESRFAGGGGSAEDRVARVRERLAQLRALEDDVEFQGRVTDDWAQALYAALCQRYGLEAYRLPSQRKTTAMVKAPPSFVEQVLMPCFRVLRGHMHDRVAAITGQWIHEVVCVGGDQTGASGDLR